MSTTETPTPTEIISRASDEVKILRGIAGLSLEEVAAKTGLSVGHLSHLESGGRTLHPAQMRSIIEVLKPAIRARALRVLAAVENVRDPELVEEVGDGC